MTSLIKTVCISVLFWVMSGPAWAQINSDSILTIIEGLDSDAVKVAKLDSILNPLSETRIPGAEPLFQKNMELVRQLGDREKEVKLAVSYSMYMIETFEPEKGKSIIEPYFEKVEEIEDLLLKGDVYYAYGHAFEDLRENMKAYDLIQKALEYYEMVGDSSNAHYGAVANALGRIAFTIGKYPESSLALAKSKDIFIYNKDSAGVVGVFQDLTILFSQIGLYDEAEDYWNQREAYFTEPPSNENVAIGLINLGRNLILQEKWDQAQSNYRRALGLGPFEARFGFLNLYAYNGLIEALYFGDKGDSIPYYFNLLNQEFESVNRSVTYEFLFKQSRFLNNLIRENYVAAERDGLDLYQNALESSDGAEIMMHARFLSELYNRWGKSDKALEYENLFLIKKDSIQEVNKTNALLLYQTQYETQEKENEIFRLQKESELLNTKISRDRLFKALLGAGLILLVLGAMLIYSRIKQAELIKMQNLRTEISSDLHDEVGSLLSGINMQTQMIDVVPDNKRRDFLQDISQNTQRAVSTMRDLVWSIDSRRDRVEDLKDKIAETCHLLLEPAEFTFDINFSNPGGSTSLNPKLKKEIYLISKEAINNIVRHSNGDSVLIDLRIDSNRLMLLIRDNGHPAANSVPSTGMGLENMQLRARQINGNLKTGMQGHGFSVELDCPIS